MATIKRNARPTGAAPARRARARSPRRAGSCPDAVFVSRRFGEEKGTNPEELIGAAHAGCFTMALAFQLSGAGKPPESLDTTADVSLEQVEGG